MNIENQELIAYLNEGTPLKAFTCPHCSTYSNLFGNHLEKITFKINKNIEGTSLAIHCPKCYKTSIFFITTSKENSEKGYISFMFIAEKVNSIKQIFPKENSIAKTLPDYIPSQLITLYEEMCELFPININASILWSRKWLEKFIILYWNDIPKTQDSLYKKIQWLQTEKKIEDNQLLDDLRFISNKGGHIESPTEEIIFTKNDSELCISIIEDLIEEYYIEPFEKNKRKENLHALREVTQNKADRIKKSKGVLKKLQN